MSFSQLLLIWAEGIEFILFPKLQLHMFGETDAKKTSTNNIVGSVHLRKVMLTKALRSVLLT